MVKVGAVNPPTAAAPANPGEAADLTFLDILLMLTQRKALIAIVTAVCEAIALLLAFALPQEYTATVTILPPQENLLRNAVRASKPESAEKSKASTTSKPDSAGKAETGTEIVVTGMRDVNDMYVSMLKSRSVEDAVVQKFGLQSEYRKNTLDETRRALEEHTRIDGSNKDGLIRLSFSDSNPGRAAEVANGFIGPLKELSHRLALSEASRRRVIFETQLNKAKIDLENANEALKHAELSGIVAQLDDRSRTLIDSAARLRAQIAVKEVQIEAMRPFVGDEHLALNDAQMELDGLNAQFEKMTGSNGGVDDVPGSKSAGRQEYVRRLRDVKFIDAVVEGLAGQLELAKLEEARDGLIQIVDPAAPPDEKSFPKRGLFLSAGAAFGFTFGVMLALLQGALLRMRQNPATRDKLDLLKRSLWSWRIGGPKQSKEEVTALRHERTEVTS